MRLSLRYDLRVPEGGAPAAAVYRTALDQCAWADRHGFEAVYLGEHHGAADGYLPSPVAFAAAVGRATERWTIHLSALVAVLHHPLRLAEDLAVVDLVSGGRLSVTLGMGYVASEFAMLGVPTGERPARLEEVVRVLPQAWTGQPFTFRGSTVTIRPRPARPGGPPLRVAAAGAPTARLAAGLGVGCDPLTDEAAAAYLEACLGLGRTVPPPEPRRIDMRVVHVTVDPERDWARVGPHMLAHHNGYAALQLRRREGLRNFRPLGTVDALRADDRYLVLTPEQCVERWAGLGVAELVVQPFFGGMPDELSWTSLRLLGLEVLPALARAAGSVAPA